MEMFTFRELPVDIVQTRGGTERGHSIADIRPYENMEEESATEIKTHRIALDFDYSQFLWTL